MSQPPDHRGRRLTSVGVTSARRARTLLRRGYARATGRMRVLPSFLIIGAQKSGTTSLHEYLLQHPAVAEPSKKEVHYFTLNAERSETWYRTHFPSSARAERMRSRNGTPMHTGEATPYYLFHPAAAARAAAVVPHARLVVLLRDPVERAHSHHNHNVAHGREPLSFEDAIAAEGERLAGEVERLLSDPAATSYAHQNFSYVARGRYVEQLQRWLEYFPREQFIVVMSEELFADPAGTTVDVQRFLGLPPVAPERVEPRNVQRHDGIDPRVRAALAAEFADDNARLADLLGRDVRWD